MISFQKFIRETSESHVLTLHPLSEEDLKWARQAQEACKDILKFLLDKELTRDDVIKLRDSLSVHSHFKAIGEFVKTVDEYLALDQKQKDGHSYLRSNKDKIRAHFDNVKGSFLKKEFSRTHLDATNKLVDPVNVSIDLSSSVSGRLKGIFTNRVTFFGTTRILENLSVEDYEKISKIDFTKKLYSYGEFPRKNDDFDYIVAYLLNLSHENKLTVSAHQYRLLSRIKHEGSEEYDQLLKITSAYLHNNDRSLVPKILALIDKIPDIKAANEREKAGIKVVYRGIPGDDSSETEIIARDKEQKYVATSTSKYAAKNFALQKGHLESQRRSEVGYIITYVVNPEAIILNTKVISTIFNESEVLIDPNKAKIKHVDQI